MTLGEQDFLREVQNHQELRRKLLLLGELRAAEGVREHAQAVGLRWLKLGQLHLREARIAARGRARRAAYSRAYYAAYNASKAVRYVSCGTVSLKGDDHGKASELPRDFPDLDKWSTSIGRLYEQRLRADYDNWRGTPGKFTVAMPTAIEEASGFLVACKSYLREKFSLKL